MNELNINEKETSINRYKDSILKSWEAVAEKIPKSTDLDSIKSELMVLYLKTSSDRIRFFGEKKNKKIKELIDSDNKDNYIEAYKLIGEYIYLKGIFKQGEDNGGY